MTFQWILGLILAVWISPLVWIGAENWTARHIWAERLAAIVFVTLLLTLERRIAQVKDAERRERKSKDNFNRVFEFAPDSIAIMSYPDLRYTFVNREWARQFDAERAIGRTPMDINIAADPNALAQRIAAFKEDELRGTAEMDLRRRDGSIGSYLISFVLLDTGGEKCVVTFGRDISALKQIERKLRESEAMMRKIFDENFDPMTIIDTETFTFIDVNQAYLRFYGLHDKHEVIGASPSHFVPHHIFRQLNECMLRNGENVSQALDFPNGHGGTVTMLTSVSKLELGGRSCLVTNARDISAMKAIERKLRDSEATLRRVIETSPDCITIVRLADSTFLEVNEASADTLGYTREELIGRRESDLLIWNDRSAVGSFRRRLYSDSVVKNMEIELRRKDGSLVPHLTSAVMLEISGESCIVSIARDISDIKRVQDQLIHAREEALTASRAKSEFLSSMSHEIRTPMNAVLGMADLLSESNLDSEQRRYLDVMVTNGNVLLELINGILDLAKIEAGRLQIEQTDFDLVELIDTTTATFAHRAHAKNLELTARIAPGVPEHLTGDPLRLRQVMVNLLGNAIKFTSAGEVNLTVEKNPDGRDCGDLLFTVEDTGIGIPDDQIEAVFGTFTQLDSSTTRRYGGSGLGLAIVNRIVELMRGRISLDSKIDVGSKFSFNVPFGIARKPTRANAESPPDLTGYRILVVDDIATNRLILHELITSCGAIVDEAASGPEALAMVHAAGASGRPYEIVLIDMRMPDVDGLETVRLIRTELMRVEHLVLMLSSDDLKHQLARLRESGLDHYLVKPVNRRELYAVISAAIGKPGPPQSATIKPFVIDAPPAAAQSILVVDDSRDNRLVIGAYLQREPYKLDFAEDGKIAVEKFSVGNYRLILMDLHMPVMDGYTATRAIRQIEFERGQSRIPIIALTASVFEDAAREARAAGCDERVAKPIKKAALLANVRKYMQTPAPSLESIAGAHRDAV